MARSPPRLPLPQPGLFDFLASDDYFVPGLCSGGCGLPVAPGRDRSGKAFLSCCSGCAQGLPHDDRCQRAATAVQESLLRSPKVAQEVRLAGPSGLAEPAVQQAILEVARARAPEIVAQAAAQLRGWAADPVVQAKARFYAGSAVGCAGHAGETLMGCIEQGPEGVRFLAFVAGCASLVLAVFDVINPFQVLGHLFTYLLSLYQILFSLGTLLFEAKPEWVGRISLVSEWQDALILNARFLSFSLGRGLFYIHQGIIWIVVSSISDVAHEVLGLFLCALGALNVLMHFEVMPQTVALKMRSLARNSGYIQVCS